METQNKSFPVEFQHSFYTGHEGQTQTEKCLSVVTHLTCIREVPG